MLAASKFNDARTKAIYHETKVWIIAFFINNPMPINYLGVCWETKFHFIFES